jgi:hypothetical protein
VSDPFLQTLQEISRNNGHAPEPDGVWAEEDDLSIVDARPMFDEDESVESTNGDRPVERSIGHWLVDGADLLAEPDPGPTPWLIENLIVDQAIVAAVGRWKTTKSYSVLDLSVSIATGTPAFGTLEIPNPGPVVFVNEESGRAALWRRLDALCRGRAIEPEKLRGRLMVAPNARVKLDSQDWQQRLLELGVSLRPRLFVFDPLARMKAPGREENAQSAMATLVEFIRQLRDHSGAAVLFVHHTGHAGGNMRGSSDLESFWETRLSWVRDGQSPLVTLESEHREAEAGDPLQYRIAWDTLTRSMRFELLNRADSLPALEDRIIGWLREHLDQKAEEVAKGLQVRTSDVRNTLNRLAEAGTTHAGPSGHRDAAGRPKHDKVWNLSNQAGLWIGPDTRTTQDEPDTEHRGSAQRPTPLGGPGPAEPPDGPQEPAKISA